jgi:serine/threonine-protein kinase
MVSAAEHAGNLRISTAEELATEYVAAISAGERVDRATYRARLADEHERAAFDELVHGAERAGRSLPRTLGEGTLLSNRYRILHQIDEGGMGRVFAALDERLERKVAVKVLVPQNVGQKDPEELFLKESKLLASLQHPNIVSVHEVGRDGDIAYIVMDLVDGTSLARVIENARDELGRKSRASATSTTGSVVPKEGALLEHAIAKRVPDGRPNLVERDWYASVARIMLEIARTIEAAHGLRVIHRDLKPSNVMLLGGGNPIVLDFGLAGSSDLKPGNVTQGLYGSVAYLAPEQAHKNQVGMDPRTDVYQLGLILYEMLTLQRAFPGTAIGEVLGRVKDGVFTPPRKRNPAVPRDLDAICMMALELDPARRYASARGLREDLERSIGGKEVPHAVRSNRWRALARATRIQLRHHPWSMGSAAVVAASLLVWFFSARINAGDIERIKTNSDRELHRQTAELRTLAMGPVMTCFRVPDSSEHARTADVSSLPSIRIQNGDPVEPGDYLGLSVATSLPQHLYVLSLFSTGDGRRFIAPMSPCRKEEVMTAKPKSPKEPWAFAVPHGTTDVVCTRIDAAGSPNKMEGLILIIGSDVQPDFEQWMDELALRGGGHGVLEADAWALYADPPVTRGVPIPSVPLATRARTFGQLKAVAESSDDYIDGLGLTYRKLEWPVHR